MTPPLMRGCSQSEKGTEPNMDARRSKRLSLGSLLMALVAFVTLWGVWTVGVMIAYLLGVHSDWAAPLGMLMLPLWMVGMWFVSRERQA